MLNTGDTVEVRKAKCRCIGGGHTNVQGTIAKVINLPNGQQWYQVATSSGFVTVQQQDIVRKIDG